MPSDRSSTSRPPYKEPGEHWLIQDTGETQAEAESTETEPCSESVKPASRLPPRRVIGIVGGLGPYAHLALEKKLLEAARQLAGVVDEQDYPEWILSSVPQTPDRTAAIQGSARSPLPWLRRSLARLEPRIDAAGEQVPGADLVIIACNTAHYFLDALREVTDLQVLDMIGECAADLYRLLDPGSPVGILATSGTLESGLYQRALGERGLEARTLIESPEGRLLQQRYVMDAIYGRPAGGGSDALPGLKTHGRSPAARAALLHAARALTGELGCKALVAGCTEIPLALPESEVDGVPLVDPVAVVSRVAVARVYDLQESPLVANSR